MTAQRGDVSESMAQKNSQCSFIYFGRSESSTSALAQNDSCLVSPHQTYYPLAFLDFDLYRLVYLHCEALGRDFRTSLAFFMGSWSGSQFAQTSGLPIPDFWAIRVTLIPQCRAGFQALRNSLPRVCCYSTRRPFPVIRRSTFSV
jgi:hypothetical protein